MDTGTGASRHRLPMLCAWSGAFAMLLFMVGSHSAKQFSGGHWPLPLLLAAVAGLLLHQLATRRWSALPAYAGCAVLGALFTAMSYSLTMLFGRLLG